MRLVEAFHGRRPWPDFELHGRPWGSSPEREERGKGRGHGYGEEEGMEGRQGAARGAQSPAHAWLILCGPGCVRDCCVRKKEREERKRKERKREKEKKRKNEKLLNLEILGEKNIR
jgi:hypothetical protein